MTNPFQAVSRLVSTVSEASTQLFVSKAKAQLPLMTTTGGLTARQPRNGGSEGTGGHRQPPFVYGRVRWATPGMIIEWQSKQGVSKESFAIYRGQTIGWPGAQLLDLSLFTTVNSQTGMVTYRAVDTTARPPGPYYYWIVNLKAQDKEQRFGPYRAASDERRDG